MNAVYLSIAIVSEIIATSALKATNGFTRLTPSIVTVIAYLFAFFFLSLPLRSMPVGVIYAIWSGSGIVILTAVDLFWFKSTIDWPGLLGVALIMAGVLVINLLSTTVGH